MKSVRSLIQNNYKKYGYLAYYEVIIDSIEQNVSSNPDICIESSKSLIEGLSKTILKTLDSTLNDKDLNNMDVEPLYRKAVNKLAELDEEIEPDLMIRSCSIIKTFGEIRNKRGDISHGRIAPKLDFSTPQFSKLVMQITESLVFYLLESFLKVELPQPQIIEYDKNEDFNQMLDELNPLLGELSYSKALYEQDYDSYFQQLLDFNPEQ